MNSVYGDSFRNPDKNENDYICIKSCGHQKVCMRTLNISRPDGLNDYQIIYILKGKGFFKLDKDELEEVGEGNIILYRPYEQQIYTYYDQDLTECYWIHLKGDYVEELLKKLGLFNIKTMYIGQCSNSIEKYKNIIMELQLKKPYYNQLCQAYFIELITHISRRLEEMNNNISRARYECLMDIIEYIYNNYNDQSTIDDYAKQCNLSRFRFIHNFKALTGESPMAYKIKIRIEKAKEYLENTSFGISEIAELTGFESASYFTRVFKNHENISPREYKKNVPFKMVLPHF